MKKRISVIIPVRNGGLTIGKCLEAIFRSIPDDFEVIVVDDCSADNSVGIVLSYPCRLARLDRHSGASKARNTGARMSSGDFLFFIDADCIIEKDTLFAVDKFVEGRDHVVCGGTYTKLPCDDTFFSAFQSIFINYSETKRTEPDYIASHAMLIDRKTFLDSGGFPEDFMPIIEDVEFSHRLRKTGSRLMMEPAILVRHIFNFTLLKSFKNAFRKSKYWTVYSLRNGDLLNDSGTASLELKTNVVSTLMSALLALLFITFGSVYFLVPVPVLFGLNIVINRKLMAAFHETKGLSFAFLAALYYMLAYPFAVGAGSLMGMLKYYSAGREVP